MANMEERGVEGDRLWRGAGINLLGKEDQGDVWEVCSVVFPEGRGVLKRGCSRWNTQNLRKGSYC